MRNKPAATIQPRRTGALDAIYSRDYTFPLVREGARRVSQGGQVAAYFVNRHGSSSKLTRHLKSPVSWDTIGDDKRSHIHVWGSEQQLKRPKLHSRSPLLETGTLSAFLSPPPLLWTSMGIEGFSENC